MGVLAPLSKACAICGWSLHAYVIMSSHYHLAVETPEPNLVEGILWLEGTFGNRLNAFRAERGVCLSFSLQEPSYRRGQTAFRVGQGHSPQRGACAFRKRRRVARL